MQTELAKSKTSSPGNLLEPVPFLVIPERSRGISGCFCAQLVMTQTPVRIQNFINGEFVEPIGGRYLDNIEPATGKPYSQVADSDARDVEPR